MRFLMLSILVMCLSGCGVSAQRAQQMTDTQLANAFFKHVYFWKEYDLAMAEEIYRRGGMSREMWEQLQEENSVVWTFFDPGSEVHHWRSCRFGRPGATIFTPHGSTTITNYGGGYVSVR